MKSNWSCTICGMSSSRRFSVQRHVQTIHQGIGGIIPFVEYVIGRREGKYPPQERPRSRRSETPFMNKIMAEIENDMARKIANAVNKPANDPIYSNFAEFFGNIKYQQMYADLLKDLQKDF